MYNILEIKGKNGSFYIISAAIKREEQRGKGNLRNIFEGCKSVLLAIRYKGE